MNAGHAGEEGRETGRGGENLRLPTRRAKRERATISCIISFQSLRKLEFICLYISNGESNGERERMEQEGG